MLRKILLMLLAVSLLVTSCPIVFAAEAESSSETVWSDEYIPNGTFEDATDYSAKSNASLVSTTDSGHGSKAISVNKGGYFYFTQYYPTPDSQLAWERRSTLVNAIKSEGRLKLEFDVKPASGDTLKALRIRLRTGSTEFGAKYLVTDECTIDGVAQSEIFSTLKSSNGTATLSLPGDKWYHFVVMYNFKGIATDESSAIYKTETESGAWTFFGVDNTANAGVTLFDNISLKTAAPTATEEPEELPPFADDPILSSGATAATEAEIAVLGTLPEGIGTIYKQTVTIASGANSTCDLLYYPNALTREGDYDLKVFLYEPTTNPVTDGTGLHRLLRYSRFTSTGSYSVGDISFVMHNQSSKMGEWLTYDGTITLEKSNTSVADVFGSQRIGFRWNTGWNASDNQTGDSYGITGQTATIYFSISLTAGLVPDEATAEIETTKWSGENLFDEAGYKAKAGASVVTVDGETVISAGTNYVNVGSYVDDPWDSSALYRITFKAKGDGTSTYSTSAKVQYRTDSLTEFTATIPAADLKTGQWHEYSMICDISTLEQTCIDGNSALWDRTSKDWWLLLRRGSSSEGPVYYKDIVFEKAVPTETGETPVYTSAIFKYKNNSPKNTVSIPQGTLILATYNSDGSFVSAVTKSFAKQEQTATAYTDKNDKSTAYETQVGGILPGQTGAVRLDITGYDSSKTYKLYVWDSLIGMNSLFGVTASK